MQMVPAVEAMEQLRGMAWVTQHGVEIDNGIEFSAVAYPRIDRLPYLFSLRSVKADRRCGERRVLERGDRCPNDPNSLLMRARDELTIAGYDALCVHRFGWRCERERRERDVIDAERHNDVSDA